MKTKVTIEIIQNLVDTERLDLNSNLSKTCLNMVNDEFENDPRVLIEDRGFEVITLDKNIMVFDTYILITGIAEIFKEDGKSNGAYIYNISIDRDSGLVTFE